MGKKSNKNKAVKKAVNEDTAKKESVKKSQNKAKKEENTTNILDNKIIFWSLFGLIVIISLALRLTLVEFPLWYDEGCSIATAINTLPAGINNYLWTHDLQHTPLYFYILHFIFVYFKNLWKLFFV